MATTSEHAAGHTNPVDDHSCEAITSAIRDLDTYRIEAVWYTVWHREQLAHGLAVDAFRAITGQGVAVGQTLVLRSPGGRVIARRRVASISVMDPTQATAEAVSAICYNSEQAGLHPAIPGQPSWYIKTEPLESSIDFAPGDTPL